MEPSGYFTWVGREAVYIVEQNGRAEPYASITPPQGLDSIKNVAQSYCPDIFNEYRCPNRYRIPNNINNILRTFPGVQLHNEADWLRFESASTFFHAVKAPPDMTDTYGELYIHRKNIYVLAKPGQPEQMEFFSAEELISSFLNKQNFINPKSTTNETFTSLQIDRLEAILDNSTLLETIREVKLAQSSLMKAMAELSKYQYFKDCMYRLLEIGMLMRGWSGEGKYPLNSLDTQNKVQEDRVVKQLMELSALIDDAWKPLADLRLLKYENKAMRFEENYPTLKERLDIVFDNQNVHACIRLTSNVFAATSWYYFHHFFNTIAFDLSQLSYIL